MSTTTLTPNRLEEKKKRTNTLTITDTKSITLYVPYELSSHTTVLKQEGLCYTKHIYMFLWTELVQT